MDYSFLEQKAKNLGFTDWETTEQQGESFEVRIFNGEISQYKNAQTSGIGFRGTYKGNMGYGSTENTSGEAIENMLENACANADIIEDSDKEFLYKEKVNYLPVNIYNDRLKNISVENKINLAKQLDNFAKNADTRIVCVDYCVLGTIEGQSVLNNSYGINGSYKSNLCYAYVTVRACENGQTKVGTEIWFDNDLTLFNPEKLAKAAAKQAVSALGASSMKSCKAGVVFKNTAVSSLFGAYENVFHGDNVQKGFSLLKGRLNEKIASEVVNIWDYGLYKGSFGNRPFDSEGVPSQNKSIIESGKLKTFLHNLKTAQKDGVAPTGNGIKHGLTGTVGISPINFVLSPGELSLKQLFQKMNNGVYITELKGLHAGTNSISGDFSLMAEGFLIENGEVVRPVEQIVVAGNFYDVLKNIESVGNDLRFDLPSSSGTLGMPSIFVNELSISGS